MELLLFFLLNSAYSSKGLYGSQNYLTPSELSQISNFLQDQQSQTTTSQQITQKELKNMIDWINLVQSYLQDKDYVIQIGQGFISEQQFQESQQQEIKDVSNQKDIKKQLQDVRKILLQGMNQYLQEGIYELDQDQLEQGVQQLKDIAQKLKANEIVKIGDFKASQEELEEVLQQMEEIGGVLGDGVVWVQENGITSSNGSVESLNQQEIVQEEQLENEQQTSQTEESQGNFFENFSKFFSDYQNLSDQTTDSYSSVNTGDSFLYNQQFTSPTQGTEFSFLQNQKQTPLNPQD